ncbi:FecR family protein [Niabella beijingensis]|uniref:FecR family protein n=1 Tax=Niabella beijingensis TaxID=2872700 RepID=UPI001CC03878|nr:FecR domain-containing protein [Niabella beijingensis]MBZ4189435.1 DUF4974 domain-containing protein [Niabella beijingensis]
MNKSRSRLRELLNRYLSGSGLTEIEVAELWGFIDDPLYAWELKALLGQAFEHQTDDHPLTDSQRRNVLNRIFEKEDSRKFRKRWVYQWPRFAAGIAAVFAIVWVSVYLFKTSDTGVPDKSHPAVRVTDVAPGKVGATLTLSNGKTIRLGAVANGEIAEENGIRILKTDDGQLVYEMGSNTADTEHINTLSTTAGETYCIVLPDRSKIWMNAASGLTYKTGLFEKGVRKVRLEGEAYFEVAKDAAHPFIVETGGQQAEVLGTHFNINAYREEGNVKTTLLEGRVKVAGNGMEKIIKPGEQAELVAGRIKVRTVQTADVIAWKNGFFSFDNEDLEAVMMKIARWYKVRVQFDAPSLRQETFYGSVSRFENISTVLNALERTGVVTFQVEGNTVTVKKK